MVFVQYVGCEYLKQIDVQRCLFECCLTSGVSVQIYLGGVMIHGRLIYLRKEKKFKQSMNPCSLSTASNLIFVLVGFSRSISVSGVAKAMIGPYKCVSLPQ